MPPFLGIDIGSSYIKAAVIELDGAALIRTARVPFPGFAVHDVGQGCMFENFCGRVPHLQEDLIECTMFGIAIY